jgi:hypothetical protein
MHSLLRLIFGLCHDGILNSGLLLASEIFSILSRWINEIRSAFGLLGPHWMDAFCSLDGPACSPEFRLSRLIED